MRWVEARKRLAARGLALALALAASAAAGQDFAQPAGPSVAPRKQPARFEVTVLRAELAKGRIDPQAERLHRLLAKRGLSYGTLRVVANQRDALMLGEIGAVMTPNGKPYRFRPLDRGEAGGFLVAVDWGTTRGDFRMEPGVPLLLGGQPKDGGQLWVVLELR